MTVDFDPVIFGFGPLQVRWYGLMYVVGFILSTRLLVRLSKEGFYGASLKMGDRLVTYCFVGMFIGARLIYVFVYDFGHYLRNPLDGFAIWKGGLSFHGAIIGLSIAIFLFARRYKIPFMQLWDTVVLCGTPGLFFGRIGNFINGELFGRATDVPWGMVFLSGGPYPRHPSQLYEAIFEGLVLGIILWGIRKKVPVHGIIAGAFGIGYGVFRFVIEFFRQPDSQLGYYLNYFSMGQILCLIMVMVGCSVVYYSIKKDVRVTCYS